MDEITASHGGDLFNVIKESIDTSSESYSIFYNGELAGIFGICPDESLLTNKALIWMLTTKTVEKMPKTFLKHSRRYINKWLTEHEELYNWVDSRYMRSVEWLKRCGAEFDDETFMGEEKILFKHFVIRRGE